MEADSQNQTQNSSGGMNKGLVVGIILAVVVLGLGVFFLTQNKSNNLESTTIEEASESKETEALENGETETAQEVMVEGKEFSYSPSTLNVKSGGLVKITFKNVGKMQHDFVIDELGIRTKVINPGEEEVVQFLADTPGNFDFYCSVGSHRSLGMEGTLTVE